MFLRSGSGYLSIISASLTPAILILATGSLINSSLTRVARIVDRARLLLERLAEEQRHSNPAAAEKTLAILATYSRRASLAERAVTVYYVAIAVFVAASLTITLDALTGDRLPWLSLALVVIGAILLFLGTAALAIETNLATGILQDEIAACSTDGGEP